MHGSDEGGFIRRARDPLSSSSTAQGCPLGRITHLLSEVSGVRIRPQGPDPMEVDQ